MTAELPMTTLAEQVRPGHTALLIVDVQNDFVHPEGLSGRLTAAGPGQNPFFPGTGRLWEAYPLIPRAIDSVRSLLAAARWSGFVGTDLDQILRSTEIRTIVVTGTATSVCIELTLRDGFFHDYHAVLVEDGCADRSAERHAATVQVVGLAFARVTTAREVMAAWGAASPVVSG
jgi:ureidoacrylate peracid hydrolase